MKGLILVALHLNGVFPIVPGVPACVDVRLYLASGRNLGDEYATKAFATHTMQDFPGE
jgi:hypothetical protein